MHDPNNTTTKGAPGEGAPLVLREGAVAVIDALGFKGIWSRVPDPAIVIAKLEELRFAAELFAEVPNLVLGQGYYEPVSTRFFSDGIVITAATSPGPPKMTGIAVTLGMAVDAVTRAALGIVHVAAGGTPPFLYRGCIAAGTLLAKGDFFVGQAIDEAAEWAEEADAAVVWLLPSARRALREEPEHLFFEWEVPTKKLRSPVRSLVLNPLARADSPSHWESTMEDLDGRFMRAFGEKFGLDVEVKKQNTRRALDAARAATRKWFVSQGG